MPKLGLEQPADLKRLERHRPGLHERLPVEHADDGVDRVLLVLKGGIELELHAAPSDRPEDDFGFFGLAREP